MDDDVTITTPSTQPLTVGKGRLTNLVFGPDQGVDSFSCVRVLFPPGHESERHAKHETMEIVYVLRGELTLVTDDAEHTIPADGAVVIPKGVPHIHRNAGEVDLEHLVLMTPPGPEEVFKDRLLLGDVQDDAANIP